MKNPVRVLVPLLEFNLHRQRPERVDGVAPVCLHLYVWWSPYSTRPQGELAEEVGAQRPVRLGGLVERERAGDMDLEWAGIDQAVELVGRLLAGDHIVTAEAHAGPGVGLGRHAVGLGPPPAAAHAPQPRIACPPAGGDERGVEAVGRELAR